MQKTSILIILIISVNNICFGQFGNISNLYNKKIVAFGEASHGDKGVYIAREKLITEIINSGYDSTINILVEMPQSVYYDISNYNTGKIGVQELLTNIAYFGLQTDSFLELIDLYKDNKKINFYGVDMHNSTNSVLKMKKIIDSVIPVKSGDLINSFNNLSSDFYNKYKTTSNIDSLKTIFTISYNEIVNFIERNSITLKSNTNFTFDILFPLKMINQCYNYYYLMIKDDYKSVVFRDSCMASNACFVEQSTKGLCLFFNANHHLLKVQNRTGYYLDHEYKGDYFVIIHQFSSGDILTNTSTTGKFELKKVHFESFDKSLTTKLKKMRNCNYLSYSDSKSNLEKRIFKKKTYVVDIGGSIVLDNIYANYSYVTPYKAFDAIYFDLNTEASTYILK